MRDFDPRDGERYVLRASANRPRLEIEVDRN